jgi:hypothetical protein
MKVSKRLSESDRQKRWPEAAMRTVLDSGSHGTSVDRHAGSVTGQAVGQAEEPPVLRVQGSSFQLLLDPAETCVPKLIESRGFAPGTETTAVGGSRHAG